MFTFILRGEWAVKYSLRHVTVAVVHVIPMCGC